MDDILDMLMQAIDERSFSHISPMGEYRQEQYCAERHLQWLEEHLNEEEKAHLEAFRNAELSISARECKAFVKTALAVGIRLALPS